MRWEDLTKANGITAKIIDEHIVDITFLADITLMVLRTSKYIYEAFPFKEMVIVPAFQAGPAIRVTLLALADLKGIESHDQQKQKERKTVTVHLFFE